MFKKIISLFIITALISALLISCGHECPTSALPVTTPSTVPEQTTTATTQTTTNCITGVTTKDSVGTTQDTFVTTLSATQVIERPMEKNVTISAGDKSVTPKLVFSHSLMYGDGTTAIGDGPLILGGYFGYNAFKEDQKEFPTLTCSSVDEIKVTVNGVEVREENFAFYDADGKTVKVNGSGTYYARAMIKFTGDSIVQNGQELFHEYAYYGAFFTLVIE
ncbi:MAG: hypothetical protein J6C89_04520 [Clostridia bacterium]|nr:hypothetical protein [Clostridia bacterium]